MSKPTSSFSISIRPEAPGDEAAIHEVNTLAFASSAEADLVDALRSQASPTISLVAEANENIVGHIFFSPVSIRALETSPAAIAIPDLFLMGLAPMAVTPEEQNQGIGSALVHAGLDACRKIYADGIVVLGHPAFYPRFGFVPAARYRTKSEYDVPDNAFMILPLNESEETFVLTGNPMDTMDSPIGSSRNNHASHVNYTHGSAHFVIRYHAAFSALT